MPYTNEELKYHLENTFFGIYSTIEDIMIKFEEYGSIGLIMPSIDEAAFNRIGMSRFENQNVEGIIKKTLERFFEHNRTKISWTVTELSRPKNLTDELLAYGFKHKISFLGMVRSMLLPMDISITSEFTFRSVSAEDWKNKQIQRTFEEGFGDPEGTASSMPKFLEAFGSDNIKSFVAFDESKPVAMGNLIFVKNEKIGLLSGAATLPEYRGRGIYSALLKLRYELAKEKDIEYLFIQADDSTSGPIVIKHGFEKIMELKAYEYIKPKI